jgi:hypothetical protein
MRKRAQSWLNSAVLTVGAPLQPGETAAQRKVILYENEVQYGMVYVLYCVVQYSVVHYRIVLL